MKTDIISTEDLGLWIKGREQGMRPCLFGTATIHKSCRNDGSKKGGNMSLHSSDLKRYAYFSGLSDDALDLLSQKIQPEHFHAGSVIIREGEVGDAFYFVSEGNVEVTKKSGDGLDIKLSVMGSGKGFGEMALLTGSIRSSSVRAITDVMLFKLPKSAFEEVVLNDSMFRIRLSRRGEDLSNYNMIKSLQPFRLLETEKMCALLERMTEKICARNENIIMQGERGDCYYIVKSGSVAVLKKRGTDNEVQVAVIGEGEAFGEEALIRDDPRNATCRAISETMLYVLTRKDFDQIVKTSFLDSIFPEDVALDTYLDEYVFIDARIPAEYEEEHICGAVNIPVEVLRDRFEELDRSKKYITYCLNDARGMVAAFLLKSRGFNAQCLRGGVSGWEGRFETGHDVVFMPAKPGY